VTPAVKREAVAHLQVTYKVSERRACSALGADRTSMRWRTVSRSHAANHLSLIGGRSEATAK
jgi:putative transposase